MEEEPGREYVLKLLRSVGETLDFTRLLDDVERDGDGHRAAAKACNEFSSLIQQVLRERGR